MNATAQQKQTAERRQKILARLRAHGTWVTGNQLALMLGITTRTVYRHVEALIDMGEPILGVGGVGYLYKPKP